MSTATIQQQIQKLNGDSPCLVLLDNQTVIRFSGPDNQTFLQGQLTCDVREVTETQSLLGGHCTAKGRMIFAFRLIRQHADLLMAVDNSLGDLVKKSLGKYAVFSKVTIEADSSVIRVGANLAGAKLLAQKLQIELPEQLDQQICSGDHSVCKVRSADQRPAYEFTLADNSLLADSELLDSECWRYQQTRAGLPIISEPVAEGYTPHMVNLPAIGGVSFKKGCYTGQEVVARTHYLGKSKRILMLGEVSAEQKPQPNQELLDDAGKKAATIVAASETEQAGTYLISFVTREDQQSLSFEQQVVQLIELPYPLEEEK